MSGIQGVLWTPGQSGGESPCFSRSLLRPLSYIFALLGPPRGQRKSPFSWKPHTEPRIALLPTPHPHHGHGVSPTVERKAKREQLTQVTVCKRQSPRQKWRWDAHPQVPAVDFKCPFRTACRPENVGAHNPCSHPVTLQQSSLRPSASLHYCPHHSLQRRRSERILKQVS